jgi:ABC-type transporter Mla MlaB component
MHFSPAENESVMLRITHAQTGTDQCWTLSGQLTGPWVAELRTCWEHGRRVAGRGHTTVDLSDVTFIDESGESLLSEMRTGGAEFVAAGVDTKHLLKHLRAKGERSLRRCIAPQAKRHEKSGIAKNEGNE